MIAKPGEKFITKDKKLALQYFVSDEQHGNVCVFSDGGSWKIGEIHLYDEEGAKTFAENIFDPYYDFNDYLKELDR